MPSAPEKAFEIYELTERVLIYLDNYLDIVRVQRVSRTWRDIIQRSPPLREACWYPPAQPQLASENQAWQLNPAFNQLGILVCPDWENYLKALVGGPQEEGKFDLKKCFNDTPGSWTRMLATQPPCQQLVIECHDDYSSDGDMTYRMVCPAGGYLLMGDVMAILAEAQNRQKCGIDRWGSKIHYTGEIRRYYACDWDHSSWTGLDNLPDDGVSIKVGVEIPWGSGDYAAFSLRRLENRKEFLHEMVLHKMIDYSGEEYVWGGRIPPSSQTEYKARLVVVREHSEGYLWDCRHIFRLLSDV